MKPSLVFQWALPGSTVARVLHDRPTVWFGARLAGTSVLSKRCSLNVRVRASRACSVELSRLDAFLADLAVRSQLSVGSWQLTVDRYMKLYMRWRMHTVDWLLSYVVDTTELLSVR
jgi:hypothetical protein